MSGSTESLERRIDELENQLTFQDGLIESLNITVAKQDREILELKQQFGRISERLKELGDASPVAMQQDETPPHY